MVVELTGAVVWTGRRGGATRGGDEVRVVVVRRGPGGDEVRVVVVLRGDEESGAEETRTTGRRRGGGAAASGEERGRGSRARAREREGIGYPTGTSILMAHLTLVRH